MPVSSPVMENFEKRFAKSGVCDPLLLIDGSMPVVDGSLLLVGVHCMMTINFDTIRNNYEVIYVIKTVMKYHLKKIDTSFHQPLPNMVQRLFADIINDAIWFMNIHEQNHP
jgi:hypothetical protein